MMMNQGKVKQLHCSQFKGWSTLFIIFFIGYTLAATVWLVVGGLPALARFFPELRAGMREWAKPDSGFILLGDTARRVLGFGPFFSGNYEPPLQIFMQYLFSLINLIFGVLLVWLRPRNMAACLLALGMVGTAAVFNLQAHDAEFLLPAFAEIHSWLHVIAGVSYGYALLLFPDGKLPPYTNQNRALTWLMHLLLLIIFPFIGFALINTNDGDPVGVVVFFGAFVPIVGIVSQVFRYRQTTDATAREQAKLLLRSLTTALSLALLFGAFIWATDYFLGHSTAYSLQRRVFFIFPSLYVLIPLLLSIVILRYQLWNLRLILNRALVYTALTALIAGSYILLVGVLGALFQTRANFFLSVLATGLIAILFQPLRQRLQQGINRLMYGERDDPASVLSQLSQRLQSTVAPDAVLPAIVETVAQALRLPTVIILLRQENTFQVAAAYPASCALEIGPWVEAGYLMLPLIYQNEVIGRLMIAPRSPHETFSIADHRLLSEIARQAGTAVHAARLTTDLRRSRERLVTAREEERRRLRRDLHDGLGPQLASLTLKLDAARNLLKADPAQTDQLLLDLKAESQAAIADIRRLVYGLRPPALDQLGLLGAIREYATQNSLNGLQISVDASHPLPPLSAAVEVAAYRIALEALTNVKYHAQAHWCLVRLDFDQALILEITDDGVGLPQKYEAGVGLSAMQERAEELGGYCHIKPAPAQGTHIFAYLPMMLEDQ